MSFKTLTADAISLLKQLIATPSFSREEERTAEHLAAFLAAYGIKVHRLLNNVWAVNQHFDPAKPTILLNSHHDTVKPNPQYTRDPFEPAVADCKLYGLGSNDAGGCLVSLLATFLHFYSASNLTHNIAFAATAEEEVSGTNGIELLLQDEQFLHRLHHTLPAFAIVGEPTKMDLAVAEKGLMVLDCTATGKAGHAARNEGDNAIYKAMKDIDWLSSYKFPKVSEWLGEVKLSVTVINTENKAHNMLPSTCSFVVDIRITDCYMHEEVLDIVTHHLVSKATPRSMRLRSTGIPIGHPIVQAGIAIGKKPYGSPTSSDKALMPFPALKCGPGDSARSHTADEFIYLKEIEHGIEDYVKMLSEVVGC